MPSEELRFNYIIAGGPGFYKVAYTDVAELSHVCYYPTFVDGIKGSLWKFIAKLNFSLRLNFSQKLKQFVHILLRRWLYPRLYKVNNGNSRPLCFIFFGTQFTVINTDFLEYLRQIHPGVKLVLYMHDIVASNPNYHIEDYKKRFDIVLSYDKGDCARYGLIYYPTPFSKIAEDSLDIPQPVDIYFCGRAKTRYGKILDVYQKCIKKGLTCRFLISGLPEEKRIKGEGLIYDKHISYVENLANVVSSRCVLEVMQENADGFTPRLWETLVYDKHLLTNNPVIRDTEYYKRGNIHSLEEIDSIDQWIGIPVTTDNTITEKLSPYNLLLFIESQFLNNRKRC